MIVHMSLLSPARLSRRVASGAGVKRRSRTACSCVVFYQVARVRDKGASFLFLATRGSLEILEPTARSAITSP